MTGPYAHPNPGGARPVERISDVLDALTSFWRVHPDLRLAQIVGNLTPAGVDPYFVEDHYILEEFRAAHGVEGIAAEDLCGRHVGMEVLVDSRWERITSIEHRDAGRANVYIDSDDRMVVRIGEGESVQVRPAQAATA